MKKIFKTCCKYLNCCNFVVVVDHKLRFCRVFKIYVIYHRITQLITKIWGRFTREFTRLILDSILKFSTYFHTNFRLSFSTLIFDINFRLCNSVVNRPCKNHKTVFNVISINQSYFPSMPIFTRIPDKHKILSKKVNNMS